MLSIIVFVMAFEMGASWGNVYNYIPQTAENDMPPLYSQFSVQAEYDKFFIRGSIRTDFFMQNDYSKEAILSFYPVQNTYVLGFGIKDKGFEFAFERACFHPMAAYSTTMYEIYQAIPGFEGWYNRVYAKMEIRARPFN